MEHRNGFPTPTKVVIHLSTYHNGYEANIYFTNSYASVIEMMLYLESNTIPDISVAVHQYAHFTHNTTALNETGVKRICRYPQVTQENGLVLNISKKLVVDYYADANLVGLWGHKNPQDPIFARIRNMFVVIFPIVLYCGCQNYRQIFLSIPYILVIWRCIVLLKNSIP